jgi:hypothetical protein
MNMHKNISWSVHHHLECFALAFLSDMDFKVLQSVGI